MSDWETIAIPRGVYISFGSDPGQFVEGKVIAYGDDAGTLPPPKNGTAPEVTVELSLPCASVKKNGNRTDYEAGTVVRVTGGSNALKDGLIAAKLNPGDYVRIELEAVISLANGNTAKNYDIKVKRTGTPVAVAPAPQADPWGAAPQQQSFGAKAPF